MRTPLAALAMLCDFVLIDFNPQPASGRVNLSLLPASSFFLNLNLSLGPPQGG
jgi:hypothetical protein